MEYSLNKINYYFLLPVMFFLLTGYAHADMLESHIAYVGKDTDLSYLGAKQGLDEANLQGQFLQHSYSMDVIAPDKALDTDYTGYIAVVSAAGVDTYEKLLQLLPNTPVFNVTLADDQLRLMCAKNALNIYPSDEMKKDAVSQWHKKHPDDDVTAQTWHPDYVKFAARDLNKRFKKSFDKPMNDAAWAGWAAVKMTSEAIIRKNMTAPADLLKYLKNDLLFDGQMGVDMNFRSNGQLRQPMLLIKNGKIAGEAPVRGVSDDLDSLGHSGCTK